MDILRVFGISSLIASLIAAVPYFVDIVKGRTKPERASWFLWSILGGIFFFTNLAEGAKESLWFAGIDALMSIAVLTLSFWYGLGGFKRRDKIALAAATVALVAWYFTDNAVIALVMALAIDSAGSILTLLKTWEKPETETLFSWAMQLLVGGLAMLAVGTFDPVLLAFPVYISVVGLLISLVIVYRRKKIAKLSSGVKDVS